MILLDTDHLSILNLPGTPRAEALMAHIAEATEERINITIISVVEQFRGWAADINRARGVDREIRSYARLSQFVEILRGITVVAFDAQAADEFVRLRCFGFRIGTMDLKIAAIAVANDALLLTANRRDFAKIPGLRFENWLV